jgi:hypothetical protein
MSEHNAIAACGDFKLCRRDRENGEWQTFELVSIERREVYYLGWNSQQQRLARNRDHERLCEHPAVHDWVLDELSQRSATEPVERAADVHEAADASAASADTAVPADTSVDARAEALARAAEEEIRRREARQARLRADEAQRQRERDANTNWHRAQYAGYLAQFGAFGWPPFP